MSETDNAEPLATLAVGDPSLLPSAFADVLDAITVLELEPSPNGRAKILDRILGELTSDHMEVVKTIAYLVELHQAATSHQTFNNWLIHTDSRRFPGVHEILSLLEDDPQWPMDARTHAEFRDYVAVNHKFASATFEHVWGYYQANVVNRYGKAETTRTDTQYAALIAWNSGYDEIHPKTVDGTSRFEAETHARRYNDCILIDDRCGEPGSSASASVVRRTVVYGPWYAI